MFGLSFNELGGPIVWGVNGSCSVWGQIVWGKIVWGLTNKYPYANAYAFIRSSTLAIFNLQIDTFWFEGQLVMLITRFNIEISK